MRPEQGSAVSVEVLRMSITMVNGYACANCAEAAKAKRGQNNALLPEAVSAVAESERPRSKLDFSAMLDKLA
jgi:hypothetical protein